VRELEPHDVEKLKAYITQREALLNSITPLDELSRDFYPQTYLIDRKVLWARRNELNQLAAHFGLEMSI
jgi:hypothetical protein